MKGLFTKDVRLILSQKRFMILYLAVALILSFSMDSSFIVSYIPMIAMLLVLSTISYDYNDNGLSFIMTLPCKPGDYAVEKYIFSATGVTLMWLVSLVLQFVSFMIQNTEYVLIEVILTDVMMLPMFLLIIAIMIPIELRYSPEKGRTVLFIIFGIVMIAVIAGKECLRKAWQRRCCFRTGLKASDYFPDRSYNRCLCRMPDRIFNLNDLQYSHHAEQGILSETGGRFCCFITSTM